MSAYLTAMAEATKEDVLEQLALKMVEIERLKNALAQAAHMFKHADSCEHDDISEWFTEFFDEIDHWKDKAREIEIKK